MQAEFCFILLKEQRLPSNWSSFRFHFGFCASQNNDKCYVYSIEWWNCFRSILSVFFLLNMYVYADRNASILLSKQMHTHTHILETDGLFTWRFVYCNPIPFFLSFLFIIILLRAQFNNNNFQAHKQVQEWIAILVNSMRIQYINSIQCSFRSYCNAHNLFVTQR